MRGQMESAVVVLGSRAHRRWKAISTRKKAITSFWNSSPEPMTRSCLQFESSTCGREARAGKGIPILSHSLKEAITSRLERKEQVMLFLNRRGYAASLQCPKCGYVAGCPNCSIALTYHRPAEMLCCHLCGHTAAAPTACPELTCRNPAIRYAGLGTQRVEDTLRKLFPQARLARMDADALKRKDDMRRILTEFRIGQTRYSFGHADDC